MTRTSDSDPRLGRPGVAAVSLREGGGGIEYLARMIHRACGEIADGGVRLVELAPRRVGRVHPLERLRFAERIVREQLLGRADWWLFNHLGIARVQRFIPPALASRYAVMLNGIEAWDPRLTATHKSVLRGAAARIAISEHTAKRVAHVHPDIGAVRACPLGLLPEEPVTSAPDAELLGRISPGSAMIVGRMSSAEQYKGHDQLIECWPRVQADMPGAQLVIVGDGSDRERLQRKARESAAAASIVFTGFVSDGTLRELYRRVGLFCMPSKGEGFGLVYLEAMRAGVPCVGSTADAAQDIIVDGETGFLVDPDDRAGLAGAIVAVLRDDAARRRLGAAGRRRFEGEFTYARFRERFHAILAETFTPARGSASWAA